MYAPGEVHVGQFLEYQNVLCASQLINRPKTNYQPGKFNWPPRWEKVTFLALVISPCEGLAP